MTITKPIAIIIGLFVGILLSGSSLRKKSKRLVKAHTRKSIAFGRILVLSITF